MLEYAQQHRNELFCSIGWLFFFISFYCFPMNVFMQTIVDILLLNLLHNFQQFNIIEPAMNILVVRLSVTLILANELPFVIDNIAQYIHIRFESICCLNDIFFLKYLSFNFDDFRYTLNSNLMSGLIPILCDTSIILENIECERTADIGCLLTRA